MSDRLTPIGYRPRPGVPLRPDLLFLDVESSGLDDDSFPVEVGVSDDALEAACWTLRPARGWVRWSPVAEGMHGLDRGRLAATGLPPAEAADLLDAAVAGRLAVSDAPEWDGHWLDRLYAAAGRARPFRIVEFGEALLGDGPGEDGAAALARAKAWDAARTASRRLYPHTHRAGEDARSAAAAWRAAADPAFLRALGRP